MRQVDPPCSRCKTALAQFFYRAVHDTYHRACWFERAAVPPAYSAPVTLPRLHLRNTANAFVEKVGDGLV